MNRVLLLVLTSDIVHKCSTITELKNIYLTNKDNFLKAKDINLGFRARQCMTKLKKSDLISKKSLVSYMNECITFITTISSKLFDRSPLASVIVRKATAQITNEIASREVELLEKKMKLILFML